MEIPSIYIANSRLQVASEESVRVAQRAIGAQFPSGYSSFVTALGEGILNAHIYPRLPDQVSYGRLSTQQSLCERVDIWKDGFEVLSRDHICTSIAIADTADGDTIVFHPDIPQAVWYLPHEGNKPILLGDGFLNALDGYFYSETVWLPRNVSVLQPDGSFRPQRFNYFRSSVDIQSLHSYKAAGISSDEIRDGLQDIATQNSSNVAMVIEEPCDSCDFEVVLFFVRDAGASLTYQGDKESSPLINIQYTHSSPTLSS